MKLNKLAFAAIVVALAFGASNAKASILAPLAPIDPVSTVPPFAPPLPIPPLQFYYQFEILNFNLAASRQGLGNSETSSNVFVSTIKTSKITSKDLLSFLAAAFNTNWPTGAQLALDHSSGCIFVVDKTGTNPVVNVTTGINIGDTNVVYFSIDADPVVFAGMENNNHSMIVMQTSYGKVFFHLFIEQNGIANTDLSFDGLDTTEYNLTRNYIVIQSDEASVTGDGAYNGTWTVVTGNVTGSGTWNFPPPMPQ